MDRRPDSADLGPDAPRSDAAQPPDDAAEAVTEAFGSPDEPSPSSPPAQEEPEDPDAHGSIVPL